MMEQRPHPLCLRGHRLLIVASVMRGDGFEVIDDTVYGRDLRMVGYSIMLVVVPALLIGSALFLMAGRAALQRVSEGSAPDGLTKELGAVAQLQAR